MNGKGRATKEIRGSIREKPTFRTRRRRLGKRGGMSTSRRGTLTTQGREVLSIVPVLGVHCTLSRRPKFRAQVSNGVLPRTL